MGKITKVILVKNAVETLGYFSRQIAPELGRLGYDTYFIDYDTLYESLSGLSKFAVKGQTAFLTFNYIGLGDEEIFRDESGNFIWEAYEMKYLNIMVDHPMYYHKKIMALPKQMKERMVFFCVDKEHVGYVRRFYPGVTVRFLPLAGNVKVKSSYKGSWNYERELIPYEKRRYDLVFTANYVPLTQLDRRLADMDAEYAAFYCGIIDDLIANPWQSVDVVMERHIREEFGRVPEDDVTEGDIRVALYGMSFLDLYVRTYFRGEIIRELAEADIKVHVFGADWDRLDCQKPQNILKNNAQISSAACVDAVQNAKISLNVMPWFKNGAHDRIFTAMLQKTVSLTDDSRYLRGEFTDGEDIVYFSLEDRKHLPDIARRLLQEEESAGRIAENGYTKALCGHTWRSRVKTLVKEL